jgi:hypothetical protein
MPGPGRARVIAGRPGGGGAGVSALAFGPGGILAVGAVNSDVYLWPAKR